ncbi:hypothetical protein AMECASPLE_039225 [Ameca splendens]|uniref:Uncharacterized protein n=1 Tax=Ameca splendens TaxID=208324 RepID=A0ABV0Z724_9TELE
MFHRRDGIGLVFSKQNAWHSQLRVQFWSYHTREFCFSWSKSPSGAFGKIPDRLTCAFLSRSGFHLATLPYRPDWWIAARVVVLLEDSPLSTYECWSSDRLTTGFQIAHMVPKWLI